MFVGLMRKAVQRPGRGSQLYVQPAELARKLVKEMESQKVSRAARVSVRNRYTIFLCSDDYARLRDRKEALVQKLERHLAKHVRAKKYELTGEISVNVVVDSDLPLGRFGILAETDASPVGPGVVFPRGDRGSSPVGGRVKPAAAQRAVQDLPHPAYLASGSGGGVTEVIAPREAANLDLARQAIVLRSGNREQVFTKGRVIIGRARDVDFRIDDSNVSRRHAAVFWSEGRIMVEDLGSTNGTMVNGYPVSSTVVGPGDVIVIGDCRITAETR